MAAGTLQIGRVGLDLTVYDPRSVSESAGEVHQLEITGQVKNLTRAQAVATNRLLLGMWGRTVPVIWSNDSTHDGFYRLASIQVDTQRKYAAVGLPTLTYPFSASLEKVHSPIFEMVYTGALVPNDHSITATVNKGFLGLPSGTAWFEQPSGTTTNALLESADGDVRILYALDSADTGPRFMVEPADYYDNACEIWINDRLEGGIGGRTASTPEVLLTNAQVKVLIDPVTLTKGEFTVTHYADSAWETALQYKALNGLGNEDGTWDEIRVVRCDPEEIRVQLIKPRTTAGVGYIALNVTLKRGWRVALFSQVTDITAALAFRRDASEAATALGSGEGIIATAASAGNKYIMLTPAAHTTSDLATTATITVNPNNTRFSVGIGSVINSAAPDSGADTADLTDQFFNRIEARQEHSEAAI